MCQESADESLGRQIGGKDQGSRGRGADGRMGGERKDQLILPVSLVNVLCIVYASLVSIWIQILTYSLQYRSMELSTTSVCMKMTYFILYALIFITFPR